MWLSQEQSKHTRWYLINLFQTFYNIIEFLQFVTSTSLGPFDRLLSRHSSSSLVDRMYGS